MCKCANVQMCKWGAIIYAFAHFLICTFSYLYKMHLTPKLPNLGDTIFTTMSVLANQYKAINLGQGFPDFPMNEELVELVNKAMKDGFNQYTHSNGHPLLRVNIAAKVENLYTQKINPDTDITVCPGATYAIYTALTTILQANDEVIVFEPAYDCYHPAIQLSGATSVIIELKAPGFEIPFDELRAKINSKTKAIIINTPHNPTGYVWTKEDMLNLQDCVRDTHIFIISDEVYEHLIFDDKKHESVLKYPELYARSFVCFSFGKTYHCTGWKLGYVIAPPALSKEFRSIHQFNAFSCDTPKQVALSTYLQNEQAYLQLGAFVQQKRDYFVELMKATPFKRIPSSGSYFECYSFAGISTKSDKEFAIDLVKNVGVAAIPVSAFYKSGKDEQLIRFCFAKKEETLAAAVERLVLVSSS